jgi:hypothetical protein
LTSLLWISVFIFAKKNKKSALSICPFRHRNADCPFFAFEDHDPRISQRRAVHDKKAKISEKLRFHHGPLSFVKDFSTLYALFSDLSRGFLQFLCKKNEKILPIKEPSAAGATRRPRGGETGNYSLIFPATMLR